MSTVRLELEEELVALLHQLNQPIEHAAQELIVLDLYWRGTISSGKATQLLGMSRLEFCSSCFSSRHPIFAMTEYE
ncbi:MAG: hypothetical protein C4291_05495 [Candidatus Dadabacteria bacterium]